MVDFHIHILPGVDHGSKNAEESIAMLKDADECGVDVVIASHHFYPDRISVDQYLSKRDHAYDTLINMRPYFLDTVHVLKGAEVLLTPGLENMPGLDKLCIEGTSFILLEMPYEYWTDWVFKSVFSIISARGLTPILAHIERYIVYQRKSSNLARILQMDLLAQMNIGYLCNFYTRRYALSMLRHNVVSVLGSDRHSSIQEKYEMKKAIRILGKNKGESWFENLISISENILANKMPAIEKSNISLWCEKQSKK